MKPKKRGARVESAEPVTVRGTVTDSMATLTPAERRVARELLAAYPLAGLETVAKLAERAHVSGPTVLRFAYKLGFDGYPDFQRALREEVHARLSSPFALYERRPKRRSEVIHATERRFISSIEATFDGLSQTEFRAVVDFLADPRRRVICTGGRWSHVLAFTMYELLHTVRPRIQFLGPGPAPRTDALLDLGKRDVIVMFDYRRYQQDTIDLAEQAAERGVPIVLFTDPWLSPIAKFAQHVLVANIEAASPFDSLVPGMALVEAVVAATVLELGDAGKGRLERFQQVRASFEWNQNQETSQLRPANEAQRPRGRPPSRRGRRR